MAAIASTQSNGTTNGAATKSSQAPVQQQHSLEPLTLPPGEPGKAYTLQSLCGEIIYIPCSKSAMRLLVTGKETSNAFALVGTGGSQSPPIGFHFHREAHDVFLCLQGNINIWAGDKARTMSAGDFASVPPGTVHQYQILGPHTEFVGLIVPGGWEEFFRFIGEPYAGGPMWPLEDPRNPFEVLIPKLKMAAEKFDMVPQPHLKSFDPQPWEQESDSRLPGSTEPYFLKAGTGPKFLVDGVVVSPLATTKESNARFEIGCIQASAHHANAFLTKQRFRFADVHHCFQVVEGSVHFGIADEGSQEISQSTKLSVGETIYVPKNTFFELRPASRFTKLYSFASGKGLIELLTTIGSEYGYAMVPETDAAKSVDNEQVRRVSESVKCEIR